MKAIVVDAFWCHPKVNTEFRQDNDLTALRDGGLLETK